MLRKRVITALWGVPLVIIVIWFDRPISWFTVLVGVWGVLAIIEFYRITGVYKSVLLTGIGAIWALLLIIQPHWNQSSAIPMLLASAVVISLVLRVTASKVRFSLRDWVWSITGIVYVGLLLSFLVSLRIDGGREWLYLAVFGTFGSDTCAYFVGRAVGRHKMAPRISPGKTWEGAVGGLLGAMVISILFTFSSPVQLPIVYGEAILLGIIISVAGQAGDLVESWLKRRMGVKESGTMLPGHGGLLDRMDSLVFAGLAVYLYYIVAVA